MRETPLVRPFWTPAQEQHHKDLWSGMDLTVLICQRKTKDLIQLSISSLLRFYPDIPILIVEGDSADESTLYCKFLELKHSNIKVWYRQNFEGQKHSSHGITLDQAIKGHTTTKYVLMLDSDVIIERGGWIEQMLYKFTEVHAQQWETIGGVNVMRKPIFAVGSVAKYSWSNDAVGDPKDENDYLWYSHPSCSMINRDLYLQMEAKIDNFGSPCQSIMKEAHTRNWAVEQFNAEDYVSHLSGSSWCEPRPVWSNDHNVFVRPFFTFIVKNIPDRSLEDIFIGEDYEIIPVGKYFDGHVILHDDLVDRQPNNGLYGIRFQVHGEWICELDFSGPDNFKIDTNHYIKMCLDYSKDSKLPDRFGDGNCFFISRHKWQRENALGVKG